MSGATLVRRYAGLAAGAAGVLAAGAGAAVFARKLGTHAEESAPEALGSLRGKPHQVVADDGVQLYAEVDEPDGAPARCEASEQAVRGGPDALPKAFPGTQPGPRRPHTLVFVHGYALNLDSWHFQRSALRGRHRLVFYDQRSHGRSGRSSSEHSTIDQLGRDLANVLDQMAPDEKVVLVGHSLGGMTIMALADQHPEWFGGRIAGVAMIATSAGGLDAEKLGLPGLPGLPGRFLHRVTPAVIATLARAPRLVETGRRAGADFAGVLTRRLAFGDCVTDEVVAFTDEMLSATPFSVVADFFPGVDVHDKRAALLALDGLPCVVVCGTLDAITPVSTCRSITEAVPSVGFREVVGAGHMVILERPVEVIEALVDLLSAVEASACPT